MLIGCSGLTLLLVSISSGGSTYNWNSAPVISMFVIGGILLITFLFVEWKVPELPMIPLNLFSRFSLGLILGSNFSLEWHTMDLHFILPIIIKSFLD